MPGVGHPHGVQLPPLGAVWPTAPLSWGALGGGGGVCAEERRGLPRPTVPFLSARGQRSQAQRRGALTEVC